MSLKGFGCAYKAGVTLSCIFIIFLYYNREMKKNSDIWLIVSAFIFSILGDWFLSNEGPSFRMFTTGIALILFSDTIISFKEFTACERLNFLILPTYYASHIIITFAMVKKADSGIR